MPMVARRLGAGALCLLILLGGRGEGESPALTALRAAEAHAARGARTAAAQAYRVALDGLHTPYPALRLAQLYLEWNRPQEARAVLDEARALGASPEATAELYFDALTALRAWDEAYALAQRYLLSHPQSRGAWLTLTRALVERGECASARQQATIWRSALPEDPYAQWFWAVLSLDETPEEAHAALCAAEALLGLDAQYCSRAEASSLRVAMALVQHNENALALCLLRPTVTREPDNATAYAWLGTALVRSGRFEEGEKSLRHALALEEAQPLAWSLLGLVHMQNADYRAAEQALFRAHQLDPGNPAPCLALARLYALQSAYEQVDIWAHAALDRAGEDATVWQSVARFYLERGQRGDVLARALQGAQAKAPQEAQTLLLLGWSALLEGNAVAARTWLDAAIAQHPSWGEAWYLRALARQQLGEDASEDFIRAQDAGYRGP